MRTLREFLIDTLTNTQLFEMAKNQQKCEDTVRSQINNIRENLSLILYFNISKLQTINLKHWKHELAINLLNAANFNVKKDKSIGRRKRIVERVFDEEDFKDYEIFNDCVFIKFDDEKEVQQGNPMYQQWLDQAIISSINLTDEIIDLIANRNINQIKSWVNKL